MQKFTKWALGSLLVCSGVLATSQTDSVTTWVGTDNGDSVQKTLQTSAPVKYSPAILKLENALVNTHFNPRNRMHALRYKRIMFYLGEAQNYDQQNWQYNRDDSLTRANNILRHHQVKTGQTYVL